MNTEVDNMLLCVEWFVISLCVIWQDLTRPLNNSPDEAKLMFLFPLSCDDKKLEHLLITASHHFVNVLRPYLWLLWPHRSNIAVRAWPLLLSSSIVLPCEKNVFTHFYKLSCLFCFIYFSFMTSNINDNGYNVVQDERKPNILCKTMKIHILVNIEEKEP